MITPLYRWIGMGGVPSHDNPRAYLWERRLHWLMIGVALLSIPAFLFESTHAFVTLRQLGLTLDAFILGAFVLELLWMLWVTHQRSLYLLRNWLDLLIIVAAAASLTGWEGEWIPLARLLRVTMVLLFLVRILGSLRNLFSPTAMPYVLGLGAVTMAIAGAGFYWLEPTVESYGEGLWLAFTSGATVGYGDFVPTTTASRLFAALMVLVGYAILSMVTASIAAFFVGEDEKHLRREIHHDIKALREEVAQLKGLLEAQRRPGGGSDPDKS
ncbi:MAG: ion transporter [Sulfuricella sp.]|nr:ion transporter [Sulfuricella sp.]